MLETLKILTEIEKIMEVCGDYQVMSPLRPKSAVFESNPFSVDLYRFRFRYPF